MLATNAIEIRGSERDEMEDVSMSGYGVCGQSELAINLRVVAARLNSRHFHNDWQDKVWGVCILYWSMRIKSLLTWAAVWVSQENVVARVSRSIVTCIKPMQSRSTYSRIRFL